MNTLSTLSIDDLATVTGGKDTSTGGTDDALLTTLNGIQSSLKDLGKNQNQGGLFGGGSGMMFMTMALAMSSQRNSNGVVVVGGGCRRRGCRW